MALKVLHDNLMRVVIKAHMDFRFKKQVKWNKNESRKKEKSLKILIRREVLHKKMYVK